MCGLQGQSREAPPFAPLGPPARSPPALVLFRGYVDHVGVPAMGDDPVLFVFRSRRRLLWSVASPLTPRARSRRSSVQRNSSYPRLRPSGRLLVVYGVRGSLFFGRREMIPRGGSRVSWGEASLFDAFGWRKPGEACTFHPHRPVFHVAWLRSSRSARECAPRGPFSRGPREPCMTCCMTLLRFQVMYRAVLIWAVWWVVRLISGLH